MTKSKSLKEAEINVTNPIYKGATPEMVGRALLRSAPKTHPNRNQAIKKATRRPPDIQSSI